MRSIKRLSVLTAVIGALVSSSTFAAEPSPVGLWKTIDDASGKPRAMIRITESGGVLQGRIETVFPEPGEGPNPKCVKCQGALKDAPVKGLVILSGLRRTGEEYGGGHILDPDTGKVYNSRVRLLESGRKLSVRGYIGLPALGRSQTWIRQD